MSDIAKKITRMTAQQLLNCEFGIPLEKEDVTNHGLLARDIRLNAGMYFGRGDPKVIKEKENSKSFARMF